LNPRATRISISVLLVALITLLGSQSVVAQSSPWVNRTIVTQYVDNLIVSYNALVTMHYGYYPNSTVLNHFRLYHAIGYSFNVTVMKWNSTTTAFVGFVFIPIISSSPQIVIDNNGTVLHLLYPLAPESMFNFIKPNNTLGFATEQGVSIGFNGTRIVPFIWVANATTMFANPMMSSADAANYLFQVGQSYFSSTQSLTQTTIISQSANTPPSGIIEWILSRPITDVIYTIIAILIAYFGGIRPVVQLATDKSERQKVAEEIRQLLRLFRLHRPKKKNEITNEDRNANSPKQDS
jgi:hypothetical protein